MEDSRRSGPLGAILLLVLIALPVLYVLSVGPACWLIEHSYLDRETARFIYYPLIVAAGNVPFFNTIFQWYMDLFI